MTTDETAFEVVDALGLARLRKRRGDLEGSAPLRAVQGCGPLIAGNAFGFQVTLRTEITLRRRQGAWRAEVASPYGEVLAASHRAVLPRLVRAGIVQPGDDFATTFADGFVRVHSEDPGSARVLLWTGLCVRPDQDVSLRVSTTANRRHRSFEVDEQLLDHTPGLVPLVLTLRLPAGSPDRVHVDGEIATVAPMSPHIGIDEVPLAAAPEVAAAHAAFYDPTYFESKRERPTRRYRGLRPRRDPAQDGDGARCEVVPVGAVSHSVLPGLPRVALFNQVGFEATYDGHTVTIDPDHAALRAGAQAVERTLAEAMQPGFIGRHPAAVRYFTTYFTLHPPGEPHFFVKPWAFVRTPPGWSCLLEGVHGAGFDVLRGVVDTEVFHAVPAVFHLFGTQDPIRVDSGDPLLEVIPVPRRLLSATFREARLD